MAHDGPEYLTLQQSVEVEPFPDPADDDEEEDVRAFLSFIPLLRFQTDKLFGAVALPVFYCVAMTLLLMNVLTFVLPVCGVRLVLVSGDLDRAMAGTWATVLATALNLLVLYWYGRLREHVETLVSEGLATKLRRCICGTADSPAAGTTGRKSPPEQRLSSASLRPLASARAAPAAREESCRAQPVPRLMFTRLLTYTFRTARTQTTCAPQKLSRRLLVSFRRPLALGFPPRL